MNESLRQLQAEIDRWLFEFVPADDVPQRHIHAIMSASEALAELRATLKSERDGLISLQNEIDRHLGECRPESDSEDVYEWTISNAADEIRNLRADKSRLESELATLREQCAFVEGETRPAEIIRRQGEEIARLRQLLAGVSCIHDGPKPGCGNCAARHYSENAEMLCDRDDEIIAWTEKHSERLVLTALVTLANTAPALLARLRAAEAVCDQVEATLAIETSNAVVRALREWREVRDAKG